VDSALRRFNQDFAGESVAQQSVDDYPKTICGGCGKLKNSSSGIDVFRTWFRYLRLISILVTVDDQKRHAPSERFGDSPCQLGLSFKPCHTYNNLILHAWPSPKTKPTHDFRQYSVSGHLAQFVTLAKACLKRLKVSVDGCRERSPCRSTCKMHRRICGVET
jgi:hypothetical protein